MIGTTGALDGGGPVLEELFQGRQELLETWGGYWLTAEQGASKVFRGWELHGIG